MSIDRPSGSTPGGDDVPAWEQMLRQMFGPDTDEALRQLRAQGMDPAAMAAASGLPDDPAMLGQVLEQIQRLLTASGSGPVNWDVAHDVARQAAVAEGLKSVSDAVLVSTGMRYEYLRRREQPLTAGELDQWQRVARSLNVEECVA